MFGIFDVYLSCINGNWRVKLKWLEKDFLISCVCDIENFCFIHEWRMERKIEMVRKKKKETETKLLDFTCL